MVKIRVNTICLIVLSCCWLFASGLNLNKNTGDSVGDSRGNIAKKGKLSIVQKLKEIDHLPVEERIALYYKLKKESPEAYDFENETGLTLYGYALMWRNKLTDAIEIFKLIVSEFPNSSNAYDSLGEGYLKNGNEKLSLVNYQKSLELNPENFNAEDQIERIKYPNRIPEKPAEKFIKIFTPEEYKADLDQLGKTLIKVHPNTLKFISREAFWKNVEGKKALITDKTTYGEFVWHCSEIIASIGCSHTDMGGFYFENEMLPLLLRFPLQTRWVNNQLFVIDQLNNTGKVKIKDEILSVNGIAVSKLINDTYKHISSQAFIKTTKKHFFNTWSTAMIPYALGFPETYKIVVRGVKDPIVLNKAETFKDPFKDPSIKHCDTNLCFEVLDDNKTAILNIASFNYYPWDNLSVFKEFIDRNFKEINKKGIKNLIIDVRFNGGGSQQSSIYLLRYLVDKPFTYYSNSQFKGKIEKIDGEEVVAPFENRFRGKLYFMMDGNGKSTTGHFMSLVKVLKLGTIVGEELGSNQFCSAGQTICRLSHTKLEYYVADNTHESTATSLPDEIGILPDHYVTQSIDDYLGKIDPVKEYTIKLAKNKK
jgi:tetratricopeptide (TPR) repeat protein